MHSGWFAFFVLLPFWAAGGCGDYLCHRASRISRTEAGVQESTLHLLQWAEVAIPVFLVLAVGLAPWTLALGAVFVVAHALTAWWDERTARPQRFISIAENHCHAFLNSVPAIAWCLGAWSLANDEPRVSPPLWATAAVVAVFSVSGALIAEELVRCLRHRARRPPA